MSDWMGDRPSSGRFESAIARVVNRSALREVIQSRMSTRTTDDWVARFVAAGLPCGPVLAMDEAPLHPHIAERETFTTYAGLVQPAPAPRFSRTPGAIERPPAHAGQHTDDVLADLGYDDARIATLRESGAIA